MASGQHSTTWGNANIRFVINTNSLVLLIIQQGTCKMLSVSQTLIFTVYLSDLTCVCPSATACPWWATWVWRGKKIFFLLLLQVVPAEETGLLSSCYEVYRAFREWDIYFCIGACSSKGGKDLEGAHLPGFHTKGIYFQASYERSVTFESYLCIRIIPPILFFIYIAEDYSLVGCSNWNQSHTKLTKSKILKSSALNCEQIRMICLQTWIMPWVCREIRNLKKYMEGNPKW